MIHFTGDFDNLSDGARQRQIVLSNLIQTYTEQTSPQTVLEEEAQVRLGVDGHVALYTVHVPETANIEIYGINGASETGVDLPDTLWIRGDGNYSLGNMKGRCGNITLKDLFYSQRSQGDGGIGCDYAYQTSAKLVMQNCAVVNNNYYNATWLARGMHDVVLDRCYLYIVLGNWPGSLIQNSHSVTLTNGTEYILKYGAQYIAYSPFTVTREAKSRYRDAAFTVKDSSMRVLANFASQNAVCHSFDWMYDVVVEGTGSLTSDRYLSLDKLVMKDSARVSVGDDSHNGYLFCSDITVEDSAVLTSDYIAVSGFYTAVDSALTPNYQQGAKNEDAWRKEVANGTNIRDGGALTMNGGTVNAGYFVGGDVNGRIVVNGGTLNAPRIGSLGAYMGILSMMPETDIVWCLFYEKIPAAGKAAVVEITGGTVNVGKNGYLGGMNADVRVSGGTVNLADGAVLGMTEEQRSTLADGYSASGDSIADHTATNCAITVTGGTVSGSGSISAPYGTVEVSEKDGDTRVSVRNFTAESGSVTIRNANGGLANAYPMGETGVSQEVGVLVSGTLSAKNLSVLDGAAVYAAQAYSDVKAEESGVLEITQDAVGSETHTALYTGGFFGMMGSGSVDYKTVRPAQSGGYQQNVYGTKRVLIQYELCDDTADPAANAAENPDGFLVGSFAEDSYRITLSAPTRFGYDFAGWYEQADYSGDPVTQILTTNSRDIVLYAKWTPRMIPFTVSVSADRVADLISAGETAGLDGSFNGAGNVFTFNTVVYVPYGSVIIGTADSANQVHLADYQLATYSITEMIWKNGAAQTILSAGSTVVDRSMVEAYDAGSGPLTLCVNTVAKRRVLMTMDMNLKNGLPLGAVFNNTAEPDRSTGTTISSYVDFGRTFGDAAGFAADGKLIVPSAPGYSFVMWNTAADGTGEEVAADEVVSGTSPRTLYAIWKANPYDLVFDAGGGSLVTADSTAPGTSDTRQAITGTVVYDRKICGNIQYEDGTTGSGFPCAWKKGYVFLGWSFEEEAESVDLTAGMKLNLTSIPGLDLDGQTALTLHAVYRKIKVTYVPRGGTWQDSAIGSGKDTVTVEAPDYGQALAGYVKNAEADGTGRYVLTGTVSTDSVYAAYSTTAAGYNGGYVEGDYRQTILRKGYTFFGWYTSLEAAQTAAEQTSGNDFFPENYSGAVGTVPEYQDITLYASWKANVYDLKLNAGTSAYSTMVQDKVTEGQAVSLQVAGEVRGVNITEPEIRWPARSDWYTYAGADEDENAKRYLLGFTFDELEPGDSQEGSEGFAAYTAYASIVTRLTRADAIFYKAEGQTGGSIFRLPEDTEYGSTVIPGTMAVPDYPTGYTIPMYAVYRERSLVFIEYVVDASGNPSRTVLSSYPYNEYVDFPTQYLSTRSYQDLTDAGYKLLKWGVNGYGINAVPYDAATYESNKESYKQIASSMGTFDINVYTVYAAQVTDTAPKLLAATGDPTASNVSTYTYKLPMSMQNGVIQYQLLANDGGAYDGFELVTKAEINANRYSPDYAGKIALTMQILGSDGSPVGEEVDLTGNDGQMLFSNASIGAGYSVRLRMYHSSVMTAEEIKTVSLKCSFYRSSEGREDMQQFFWLKNIQTKLTPSLYTVVYDAGLPGDPELNVTNWNDFAPENGHGKRTVKTAYGSALLADAPVVEGYMADGTWTRTKADGTDYSDTDGTMTYGADLTLPVSAADNGTIYLRSGYQIESYRLKLTSEVFDKWTVQIDGQEVKENLWNSVQGWKAVTVDYHQSVAFVGKTDSEPAEFIRLECGGKSLGELDLYASAGAGNTYTFKMPNHDIDASYEDLKTLYLEDGSISLIHSGSENGYRQADRTLRTWRGRYKILMDADDNADGSSTENRLVLDGDLRGREITLGKLNITADDSIALKTDAKAELNAAEIRAKNIAVPAGAELTLGSDSKTKAELTLTPAIGYAAIGGHNGANGEITLDKLKISMTLPAGSAASGIGAGRQEALTGCGEIRLTDCEVAAEERSTASSAYMGSWIGGTGVPNVIIRDSVIGKNAASDSVFGPYVLKAVSATVEGSRVGTGETPVSDPIYASDSLTITASTVYQRLEVPYGSTAAIGTRDGGIIAVRNSTIDSFFAGSGSSDSLYTGKMAIYDAASDVNIKGVQILDVNNGSVEIEQTQVSQGGKTHAHSGSYLLLNEFDAYDGKSSLTVSGLSGSAKVQTNAMTLRDMQAGCDIPLYLNGDLTLSGTARIAEGKTLDVMSGTNTFTAGGFAGNGSYRQTGGRLTGTGDLIVGGNMTLDQVTADLPGKRLGSSGASGVTTVTILDSAVNAARTGALGAQNETFTFVVTDDGSTVTGDLIRDHYRIRYDLPDGKYDVGSLPKVLRSTTTAEGITYVPAIPDAPTCTGTSSFRNWYMTKPDGTNVALSRTDVAGFTEKAELDASCLDYGSETDPKDGTKTLTLHAWMGLEGKSMIRSGYVFSDMGACTDTSPATAVVVRNGQWTARFEVKGTVIAGSKYRFRFSESIPAGTRLTLCDRSGGTLKWYYYTAQTEVSAVTSDQFTVMGGRGTAVLPDGDEGDAFAHVLQLTVDFTSAAAKDNTVSLELAVGTQTLDIPGTTLTYTVVEAAGASITAVSDEISLSVTPGNDDRLSGKKLYAVAVIENASGQTVSAPYGASAACGSMTGTWLGGNTAVFELGDYQALRMASDWSVSGLPAGDYTVTWYLTAAEDLQNPFDHILAQATPITIRQDAVTAPAMTATLTGIDGGAPDSQVLAAGSAHTIRFTVETNQSQVDYWVEEQTALKNFSVVAGSKAVLNLSGSTVTVTIPGDPGTYRVRFSIRESSDWDDVYCSFIVK